MTGLPPAGFPAVPPAVLRGDRAALARAISRVEQGLDDAAAVSAALGAGPAPRLGRAHVIGLTGAPGAGKSTLADALLGELVARGRRIGVVAVDPSSPLTGGAVLGDRVRMGRHGAHPDVFIRSVASRGRLGGLSPTTRAIVDLFDAAGFDTVIVETVGAGQSEVAIMEVADTRLVACPPGLGDDVQAIKAGILEIADVLVVTKADLPGAAATARDLASRPPRRGAAATTAVTTAATSSANGAPAWQVPVAQVSAVRGEGIAALVDLAQAHAAAAGRGLRLRLAQKASPARDDAGAGRGAVTPEVSAIQPAPAAQPPQAVRQAQTPPATPASPAAEGAEAVLVRRLAARDPFLGLLGIRCTGAGAGFAEVRITLRPEHLSFNGTCHGGVVFTLADTAFGLAANSHGTVAAGIDAHITYQQPAAAGDTLVASAREVSRSRKLAVYRVEVTRADGLPVSSFTGTVYLTGRPHG